jgi:hypothetical protein
MPEPANPSSVRIAGHALAFFAFDIGFQVDLDAAEPLVREATRRRVVRARRPAPVWFDYSPPPLRLVVEGDPVTVGDVSTEGPAEVLVYDFGAALLTYRLPLPEARSGLPAPRRRALRARRAGGRRPTADRPGSGGDPAGRRTPRLADASEDYAVFAITSWGGGNPSELARPTAPRSPRRSKPSGSSCPMNRSTAPPRPRCPTRRRDLAIVDWNAAVLFDAEPDDVISVLQHANVELLELRVLDRSSTRSSTTPTRRSRRSRKSRFWPAFAPSGMLRRFASARPTPPSCSRASTTPSSSSATSTWLGSTAGRRPARPARVAGQRPAEARRDREPLPEDVRLDLDQASRGPGVGDHHPDRRVDRPAVHAVVPLTCSNSPTG